MIYLCQNDMLILRFPCVASVVFEQRCIVFSDNFPLISYSMPPLNAPPKHDLTSSFIVRATKSPTLPSPQRLPPMHPTPSPKSVCIVRGRNKDMMLQCIPIPHPLHPPPIVLLSSRCMFLRVYGRWKGGVGGLDWWCHRNTGVHGAGNH